MIRIEIDNELRDRAYQCACEHGFHDKVYSDEHWMMFIITEISEAVNADRNGKHALVKEFNETTKVTDFGFKSTFERCIKDTVEDELADVVIRCLDYAGLKSFELYNLVEISSNYSFTEEMYYAILQLVGLQYRTVDRHSIMLVISLMFKESKNMGADLLWHIEQKMKYNELRPMLNGKAY